MKPNERVETGKDARPLARNAYPGGPVVREIRPEDLGSNKALLRAAVALGLSGWVAGGEVDHVLVGRARQEFQDALRKALGRRTARGLPS